MSKLTHDQIRDIFLANGFSVKEGRSDLEDYVFKAAYALLNAAQAPSVPVPKQGGELPQDERAAFEALREAGAFPHHMSRLDAARAGWQAALTYRAASVPAQGDYQRGYADGMKWCDENWEKPDAASVPAQVMRPIGYAPTYLTERLAAGDAAVMLTVTRKPLPGHGVTVAIYTAPISTDTDSAADLSIPAGYFDSCVPK